MAQYSAQSDLNLDAQRLIQLTDSLVAPGVADQVLISALGDEANARIDAALMHKYVVPFAAPVPLLIRYAHADIWRYLIYKHRPDMPMPDTIVAEYKRAMAELDEIAEGDGKKELDAPRVIAQTSPSPTSGQVDTTIARVFGRGRDGLG